jgi:sec-independent protein translocase protein TatA
MDFLSPLHIIVLLIVALLVFGPKRLPEIGAGLGKAIREFRDATSGAMQDGVKPPTYPMSFDAAARPSEPSSEHPDR